MNCTRSLVQVNSDDAVAFCVNCSDEQHDMKFLLCLNDIRVQWTLNLS